MKVIFALIALISGTASAQIQNALTTESAPILTSQVAGRCIAKDDPLYEPLCQNYPIELACSAYPFCLWVD